MEQRDRDRQAERARPVAAELSASGVSAVAVTWVDTSGITRVKTVPMARLEHAAAWGIGASPVFDGFLVDDSIVSGRYAGGPVGDLRLHPDLDRLTVLAALPGWAWAPADRYDQDGVIHPQDARSLLRREVGELAAEGYSVRAAVEVEWAVSAGDGAEFVPACAGPAYGMTRITELSGYLTDLLETLAATGIAVDQFHPEYAAGQFELSVAAADPLGAADTAVLVRETVRAVSAAHGLRATFAPKVLPDGVGNGGHVHLSLWHDGRNVMTGGTGCYDLTASGAAFIAGILDRLPALLAVGCPSVASYLRLVPSHWAGAFACWGLENREAAIRFVRGAAGSREQSANVEVKCFDAAANPYLALTALLAAGRAGLAHGGGPPDPVEVDPASLDPAARAARGIAALPSSLEEAVEAFESDSVLHAALGPEVMDTIAVVRRGEIALFADADPAEICARTRWRY
jgi:glutamine synthetase